MDWRIVGGVITALLAAWVAFVALLWVLKPTDTRLGDVVRVAPDVLRMAQRLLGDPTASLGTKVAVVGLLAWLLNPIDLIPDVIPVLGSLDDIVIAVLVLRYVRRRIGDDAFRRCWPGTEDGYALLSRVL